MNCESDLDISSSSFSNEDMKLIRNMLNKPTPFNNRHSVVSSSKSNKATNLSHDWLSLFHSSKYFTQVLPAKPPENISHFSNIGPLVVASLALNSLQTILSSSIEDVSATDSHTIIPITDLFVDLSASQEDFTLVLTRKNKKKQL